MFDVTNPAQAKLKGQFTNVNDTLATHGLDVYNGQVALSFLRTPFHIPPLTPFYADPGGIKILNYDIIKTTGLSDMVNAFANSGITMFPNPLSAESIEIRSNEAIHEVMVFNELGQEVYILKGIKGTQLIIMLPDKSQGFYLFKVITSDHVFTRKVVVMK